MLLRSSHFYFSCNVEALILILVTLRGNVIDTNLKHLQGRVVRTDVGQLKRESMMKLGAFSVSLAVKDIEKSRNFYRSLGFSEVGGEISQHWLIMRNETHTIGLFQGMFDKNMLTFNPGWSPECKTLSEYTDVRDIQAALREQGIEPVSVVDASSQGPGSLMLMDPDGNPILIDQHV